MSYKSLLDKSLEGDATSPLSPEPIQGRPVPPPRVDLMSSQSSNPDELSTKLLEQADQFEKSSSRQNSPSLNELREMAKVQRPVPAKRSRQPTTPLTQSGKGSFVEW